MGGRISHLITTSLSLLGVLPLIKLSIDRLLTTPCSQGGVGHMDGDVDAKFPFSANNCAWLVSKARQSDWEMAAATTSCMLRGVASQHRRRRWLESSSLNVRGALTESMGGGHRIQQCLC